MHRKYIILMPVIITALFFLFPGCKENGTGGIEKIYQNVSIPAAGGTVALADGITLEIPAGAVAADTAIQIRKIDPDELVAVFKERGIDPDDVIAGYEALPDGLTFATPITVRFTGLENLNGAIPVIHYVDFNANTYSMSGTEGTYDPDAGTLEVKVTHFSGVSAQQLENLKAAEYCEDNCRCGDLYVKSEALDNACSDGDCQITDEKVSVTFLDCQGTPTEVSYIQEISSGCAPKITFTAESASLVTGESTTGTATVGIGCRPLSEQSVTFSYTGPVTIDPTGGMGGTCATTITAKNAEATATVTAASTVSYNTYWIYAEAGGVNETAKGPLKTKAVSKDLMIAISLKPLPGFWQGGEAWMDSGGSWDFFGLDMYLYDDGTCTGDSNWPWSDSGTWSSSGSGITIIWNHDIEYQGSYVETYSGTIDETRDYMSGTYTWGARQGPWSSRRTGK